MTGALNCDYLSNVYTRRRQSDDQICHTILNSKLVFLCDF